MANLKQRKKALRDIGMYFAEKGKILSQKEYIDSEDKPVLFSGIRRVFRSYSRMVEMLKHSEPDLFQLADKKPEVQPKPEVKVTVPPKITVAEAPKVSVTSKVEPKVSTSSVKPTSTVGKLGQ